MPRAGDLPEVHRAGHGRAVDAIMSLQASVTKTQAENQELYQSLCSTNTQYGQLEEAENELRAEAERLREVAKFYGDGDTYHIDILGSCGLSDDMDEDGLFGKRAREALEAIEKARQPK